MIRCVSCKGVMETRMSLKASRPDGRDVNIAFDWIGDSGLCPECWAKGLPVPSPTRADATVEAP